MIAIDADLVPALRRPSRIRRRPVLHLHKESSIGQRNQVLFLGQHELRHAAIALPAIGSPILFTGARNHVTAAAIVAHSASGDVIHNHAVARLETAATLARSHNLAAWLVPGDYALVAFRSLAQMLVINAADIRPADRRGLHAQ